MATFFQNFPLVNYNFGNETDTALFQNISAYIKIIDDLIMKEKRRVKLLEEYRNSILNEMVTGKKRIES